MVTGVVPTPVQDFSWNSTSVLKDGVLVVCRRSLFVKISSNILLDRSVAAYLGIFEPPATSSEVNKLSILHLDAFGLCVVRAAVM